MMLHASKIGLAFTPDVIKASFVLCLISTAMVIGLFAYVARQRTLSEFNFWAVAWLFYATFLVSQIAPGFLMENWQCATIPTGCVAMAAWLMICGNLVAMDRPVRLSRVVLVASLIALVDYLAASHGAADWFSLAAFWTLGLSGLHVAYLFCRGRRYTANRVLVAGGFVLWALAVVAFPLSVQEPATLAMTQTAGAAVTLVIALGVIVEQEIESTEQKYRSVLDGTTDAVFIVDLWKLKVLDANQNAARLARRETVDLVGMDFLDLCPDLRREGTNLLDQRKMFAAVFKPYNEFHFVRADGSMVLCEGDTNLAHWRKRSVVQVRMHEVEPDKNIGQVVRRAEKMSTLGQLIAGVAHELNNPLAVVLGYAQILSKHPINDPIVENNLQRILHESDRAAKIVRDLLLFARPCQPQLTVVDINKIICNVCDVRHRDFAHYEVELHQGLDLNLSRTKADPIQLEQVLNNLITNALHAMSSRVGGRALLITTKQSDHFIRISITDNGCGIPPDVKAKMFDAFFTTKPAGKGTGLGLSISRSILEEHHGRLDVESEVGQGATFHLELPIAEIEELTEVVAAPAAAPQAPSRGQRLLIVDDEPGIREVLGAILESQGYVVTNAGNGVEALNCISHDHFDLIISDMCMPEMDGERLYETLREKHPALAKRIVFVTGDTVSARSRTFLESSGRRWLTKPFNISDVEEMVAGSLEQSRS